MIPMTEELAYAIDFGTSNSLLSVCNSKGDYEVLDMDPKNSDPKIFKSLLFTPSQNEWHFGVDALHEYVEQVGEGRFFRSIKKFLPEENFTGTIIHGKRYDITDIVAVFLREMKLRADQQTGKDVKKVLLGRPASYSESDKKDQLAQKRMESAAIKAGFEEVKFCPEPVAAAYGFAGSIKDSKLTFIADLGGGTSDFTIMRLGGEDFSRDDVLGLGGIFVAGDAIDGGVMRSRICHHFGAEVKYSLPMGGRELSFPKWLLTKMCNPAHMAFLKEKKTYDFLKEIETFSLEDEHKQAMDWLFTLVEEQLGHSLFSEIEKMKISLSSEDKTLFKFNRSGISIEECVSRSQFDDYTQKQIEKIQETLAVTFEQSGIKPNEIDIVCVTGGTGQLPKINSFLSEIFGADKLANHNHFKSVIDGLGQHAYYSFWPSSS